MHDEQENVDYPTELEPPSERCACGTASAAIARKPRGGTLAWWDDPSPFWQCPSCGAYRGGLEEWNYSVSQEEFIAGLDLDVVEAPKPASWWRRLGIGRRRSSP